MVMKIKDWLQSKNKSQFEIIYKDSVHLIKCNKIVVPFHPYKADGYMDGITIELIHFSEDKVHVEYVCYWEDGSVHHGDIVEADRIQVLQKDSINILEDEDHAG